MESIMAPAWFRNKLADGRGVPYLAIPLVAILFAMFVRSWFKKTLPLPPGPKRLPFIGNALDMPREKEWLTFTKWARTYGDIVSLSIFGRSIIVVSSEKAADELLNKRSFSYSDRPYFAMGGELVGWDHTLVMAHYGHRLRKMRRLMHEVLGPRPVQMFWPAEERETARFLDRLLVSPERLIDHIRHTAGAVVLKISHGYTVSESKKDLLVDLAEETVEEFSLSSAPGAFLVDFVPWLKHIPSWFPGAGFHRIATKWRKDLFHTAKGIAVPSLVSKHLEGQHTPETEELVKWAAFSMYAGGADTTVAAVSTFFLAMCLNPEVQIVAQAELDAVVGSDRLPTMADRGSLPYVEAVLKEVLRWGPVAPSGVPHRLSSQDDEYEGYRIPAGSIIISNIWGMLHDPENFPNPDTFQPQRFTGKQAQDKPSPNPMQIVFGYGRRICPGQHLAEPSLFLAIAMTLATFTIEKARDGRSGEVVEPVAEWLPGTISHPKPFSCTIKPRSAHAVALIKRAVEGDRT